MPVLPSLNDMKSRRICQTYKKVGPLFPAQIESHPVRVADNIKMYNNLIMEIERSFITAIPEIIARQRVADFWLQSGCKQMPDSAGGSLLFQRGSTWGMLTGFDPRALEMYLIRQCKTGRRRI